MRSPTWTTSPRAVGLWTCLASHLRGAGLARELHAGADRIWDLAAARCSMSLRTAHRFRHLAVADECIAAAGDHGPYFRMKTQASA